jgi:hypothetical protein
MEDRHSWTTVRNIRHIMVPMSLLITVNNALYLRTPEANFMKTSFYPTEKIVMLVEIR